jgi:hypothetical protein
MTLPSLALLTKLHLSALPNSTSGNTYVRVGYQPQLREFYITSLALLLAPGLSTSYCHVSSTRPEAKHSLKSCSFTTNKEGSTAANGVPTHVDPVNVYWCTPLLTRFGARHISAGRHGNRRVGDRCINGDGMSGTMWHGFTTSRLFTSSCTMVHHLRILDIILGEDGHDYVDLGPIAEQCHQLHTLHITIKSNSDLHYLAKMSQLCELHVTDMSTYMDMDRAYSQEPWNSLSTLTRLTSLMAICPVLRRTLGICHLDILIAPLVIYLSAIEPTLVTPPTDSRGTSSNGSSSSGASSTSSSSTGGVAISVIKRPGSLQFVNGDSCHGWLRRWQRHTKQSYACGADSSRSRRRRLHRVQHLMNVASSFPIRHETVSYYQRRYPRYGCSTDRTKHEYDDDDGFDFDDPSDKGLPMQYYEIRLWGKPLPVDLRGVINHRIA